MSKKKCLSYVYQTSFTTLQLLISLQIFLLSADIKNTLLNKILSFKEQSSLVLSFQKSCVSHKQNIYTRCIKPRTFSVSLALEKPFTPHDTENICLRSGDLPNIYVTLQGYLMV